MELLRVRRTRRYSSVLLLLIFSAAALGCGRSAHKELKLARAFVAQENCPQALIHLQRGVERADAPALRAEILALRGECLWKQDQPREAYESLVLATEVAPDDIPARLRIADVLIQGEAADLALPHVMQVLQREPNNTEALTLSGHAHLKLQQYDAARSAYSRALLLDPRLSATALALADLQYRLDDAAGARALLARAGEITPEAVQVWLALGRLEEREGRDAAAEAAYRRAVEVNDDASTNLRLAQFLQRSARLKEAEEVLRRVDALRPQQPIAVADSQLLSNRVLHAIERYKDALTRSPQSAQDRDPARVAVHGRLIEAYLQSDNAFDGIVDAESGLQKARAYFTQHRYELDDTTALLLQAEIELAAGDASRSLELAEQATQRAPQSVPALYILGLARMQARETAAAVSAWSEATTLDPAYVPARLALAEHLLAANDLAGAETQVAVAVREEPGNFRALVLFADVLLKQGRPEAAYSMLQRAMLVDPKSPEPYLRGGEVALHLGDASAAIQQFHKALTLDAASPEAVEGMTRVYQNGDITRQNLTRMEHIAQRKPFSPALMEVVGRLYAHKGWHQDAARAFRQAIRMGASPQTAAVALSRTYARAGATDRAADMAEAALGGRAQLLRAYLTQQVDKGSAAKAYEDAVRGGDPTGIAANNLAWIYAEQGIQLERALELAKKAAELNPRNAAVLDTLGYVHLRRREFTDAVDVLKRATLFAAAKNSQPKLLAQVRTRLAQAYRAAGQPEAAQQALAENNAN